ncbi:hypothetical protein ABPG77_009496 [Micractinium sp. CCAP 211/92]
MPASAARLMSGVVAALCAAPAGNGLVPLAQELIAAKLNRLQPSPRAAVAPASVADAMAQADALIGGLLVPPLGAGSLPAGSTSTLVGDMAAFNGGELAPLAFLNPLWHKSAVVQSLSASLSPL